MPNFVGKYFLATLMLLCLLVHWIYKIKLQNSEKKRALATTPNANLKLMEQSMLYRAVKNCAGGMALAFAGCAFLTASTVLGSLIILSGAALCGAAILNYQNSDF